MKRSKAIIRRILIKEYFRKFPGVFTEAEQDYLLWYAANDNGNFDFVPELIRELYDELGFIEKDKNIYEGFIDLICRNFDITNKNIIEVGGGALPRLGERISHMQENGKIIIYDPRLSVYKHDDQNLKLIRKKFNGYQNIEGTDLLIGLMPCGAASTIVNTAIDNKIDFVVALCEGGPHGGEFDYYEDEEEWRNSIISMARSGVQEQQMGDLKIEYMKSYGNPYPVIYNKRKTDK